MLQLYALGSNGSGQLGTGDKEDAHSPKKIPLPADFSPSGWLSIAAGGNHTLLSTPDSRVYAAGDMSGGRYSIVNIYTQAKPEDALKFRLSAVNAAFYAATWESSTIIDDVGRVLVSGTGTKGELGLGDGISQAEKPTIMKDFPPDDNDMIADLSASMSHTACLLINGDVYAWGSGRKGQLGNPAQDCWAPRKVEDVPFDPHRVVCGKDFTYIVGSPSSGEHLVIGNDKWGVVSQAPAKLPPWKDIAASWGSIFVLLESGELLSWGRNDRGQLGPKGLPELSQIAVGSEHVVAVTVNGKIITWGWGEHGNCGQPVDQDGNVNGRYNEVSVAGKAVFVGAGCATTFIATIEEP